MTRPTPELLLAFLEGRLSDDERIHLLDLLESDTTLADELRVVALGLEAAKALPGATPASEPQPSAHARLRRISPWWAVGAAAASVALAVPLTLRLAGTADTPPAAVVAGGQPIAPEPSFLLVLHGRWPDAAGLAEGEGPRRASEYWEWTTSLARDGLLLAAGDLRWEPGERLGPAGRPVAVSATTVENPDYVVGMIAIRAASYADALELARACPHLRYGGSVSVRRVGAGFVTVPGTDDWTE